MARILTFGDSITYGRVDSQGGWANRLRKYFDEQMVKNDYSRDFPNVYNQGISGDTAEDILQRFDIETKARLEEEIVFVLAVGTNDSVLDNGRPRYSESQFRNNYEEILQKMEKHSNKILTTGLLPVDEKLTTPIPWRPQRHYTNRQILLFNGIIKDLAATKNLPYVALYDLFLDKLELFPDGLHPNDKGHQLIFEQIQPAINRLL